MIWIVLTMIVALAVLGPLFGSDTRDGHTDQPRQNPR